MIVPVSYDVVPLPFSLVVQVRARLAMGCILSKRREDPFKVVATKAYPEWWREERELIYMSV